MVIKEPNAQSPCSSHVLYNGLSALPLRGIAHTFIVYTAAKHRAEPFIDGSHLHKRVTQRFPFDEVRIEE